MHLQILQKDSLLYAVIDNLYSKDEIASVQKEIEFLQCIKQQAVKTSTAKDDNGNFLKTGQGIFVDNVYTDRNNSTLLALNRKLFSNEVVDKLISYSCFYQHIRNSNHDSTLLNFYGNGEKYDGHRDKCVFTAVTFFSIGQFQGGHFSFPDYDVSVDPIVGRVVLFPGCVLHKAEPIIAEPGNYRVTMAQFIGYADK